MILYIYKVNNSMTDRIAICPRCKRPAKDTRTLLGGVARDIGNTFKCDNCGYRGPYITLTVEEYEKLLKEEKKEK